jgi:Fic family protein
MEPFHPNSLPPKKIDWSGLVTAIGDARDALGEYRGRLGAISHPHVLLSPLTTNEAVLSSRIEGTVVTLQEVLRFEDEPQLPGVTSREQDIAEVVNYRKALAYGFGELLGDKPVGLNSVKRLHWILMDSVRGKDKDRGEFRRVQNHIGPRGSSIEDATYVPPPPGHPLMEHLYDWESYYHDDNAKDPIVQAALLHAQFELIHPFVDGNGRVGRMLIPLFLCERKVLPSPTFYISGYLEATRDDYSGRLLALSQEDDWDGWIRYFLLAATEQARKNSAQAADIMELRVEAQTVLQESVKSPFSRDAIEFLFSSVIFSAADFWRQTGIKQRQTARNILQRLVDARLLEIYEQGRGRRSTVYIFPKLFSIVDA